VLDEFGSVQGLITVYDVMQVVFGELPTSEEEPNSPMLVELPDGSFSVDGQFVAEELFEKLEFSPPQEMSDDYETLAGFIMIFLGQVPTIGSEFDCNGYHFEVVDMDGNRIDRVKIHKRQTTPPPDEQAPE
jgi:putative hemolysin